MKNNRYFRHDWGARNDPKMLRLVRVKGAVAKAVYWDIIEMLYEEGGELPIEAIEDISFFNHLKDSEVVKYVVFESGLFSYNDTHFWSERQKRDDLKINEISKARSEAGKAGGYAKAKQTDGKSVANANQTSGYKIKENKINKDNNIDSSLHSESISSPEDLFPKEKDMTPEEMRNLWNEGRGKLPKVATLTEERKRKAKARITEFGKTKEEQTATMQKIMEHIAKSDFLQVTWGKCNFDWLITNSGNWVKVIEGNYDNNKPRDIRDIKNVNDLWKD